MVTVTVSTGDDGTGGDGTGGDGTGGDADRAMDVGLEGTGWLAARTGWSVFGLADWRGAGLGWGAVLGRAVGAGSAGPGSGET